MPNKSIISEGNTTNEAIEKGLKKLNVSKNKVNIKVLESEDKRSFFSILAPRVVKVEMTLKDEENLKEEKVKKERKPVTENSLHDAENKVKIFLDEFFEKIDEKIKYTINKNEFGLEIVVKGEEAGYLIGYRGETLYALQSIISNVANRGREEKIRIILDIEDYKQKREKTLQNLALKISKKVEKTGKSVTLEPMQAYERKIIHSYLQDSKTVKTESIGEEPRRRVVISLK